MADEIQQKVLISVESKLGSVKDDLLELNQTLTDQLTTQKLLELQGKRNTEEYISIASQVRLTKQAIRDSNRELDNTVKALNAASNSIQQNRALLSTLTTEYIRLGQTEGQTAASTLKLKGTIDQLNLTLKEQEKGFTTARNVGNYANDIGAALSQITGFIPGMQQFGAITQVATKVVGFLPSAFTKAGNSISSFFNSGNPGRNVIQGFGKMEQSTASAAKEMEAIAPAAVEAEGGLEGMGAATAETTAGLGAVTAGSVATGGAIAGLVGIIAGAVYWFSTLGSVGIKSAQVFAGVKASALALFNDISQGNLKNLAADMKLAYNNGVELKKGMQALERTQQQSDLTVANYDREIALNMQALRYRKITYAEAVQIDKETGKMEDDRVKLKEKNLRTEFELTAENAINGKKYNEQERDEILATLRTGKLAAIQKLEMHNKVNKGISKDLHDIGLNIIAAQQEADLSEQKTINRQAIIEQRFGKAAAKFQQAQITELAQANANIREAENVKLASIARQMEFTYSAFGKELAATDLHYKELIFKEMQFVAQQEKLAKLAKSPAAKNKFLEAKEKGLQAIKQIGNEWDQDLQKVVETNTEKMSSMLLKSGDDLLKATIQNIKDTEQKEIASIQLQEQIRIESFEQEKSDRDKEIRELQTQASTADQEEKTDLLSQVTALQKIQDNANAQMVQDAQKTADDILQVKKKAAEQDAIVQAKINVVEAGMSGGENSPFNDKELAAKQQLLAEESAAEISQETLTDNQRLLIYDTYLQKKKALDDQYEKNKKAFVLDKAAEVANDAVDIFEQSLQSENQANEAYMERQKNHDLSNQSLTATQKYAISEKYRILEGQAKQREFKQEQKIDILKAIILGAKAVIGDLDDPWKIPFDIGETAAQVAVIASKQPPAYATGNIHYTSDGTGALLRGPGTGKSDSMNARLSNGEAVINAKSTSIFGPLLSAINTAGGGRPFFQSSQPWYTPGYVKMFASGGVMSSSTYLPTSDNGLRINTGGFSGGNTGRMHPDDLNGIVNGLANAVANINFPSLDIKDVNRAGGLLTAATDRGSR